MGNISVITAQIADDVFQLKRLQVYGQATAMTIAASKGPAVASVAAEDVALAVAAQADSEVIALADS